ncbi:MAG: flagellar assembly protein FliH [Spirochaetaceae bacterium]|nr:flagellar assembly protein FliH [Spirochaetaceae bacterium]
MAKTVFRPGEIALSSARVVLSPPFPEEKPLEAEPPENLEEDDDGVFIGPTPAELEAEANKRRTEWEAERIALLENARAEATALKENAQHEADEKLSSAEAEAVTLLADARKEAEKTSLGADDAAASIKSAAETAGEELRKMAQAEGFEKGREEGYAAGFAEVQRLVVRTQVILERLQDKRSEVIAEAEQQIVDLTLVLARKIVKTISESQRTVVIENIKEALAKVKSRGKITIKVNLADLELSTAHLADFTRTIEGAGNIQILEDTSVDPGGCVIETDFGEIDARIASQFAELEARILELSPIKSRV